jgi:hypothetical protein
MSKFAIRLLTLAIYATALVVVPMATPAEAATNSTKEIRKNKKKAPKTPGFSDPWSAGQPRPVAGPSRPADVVCSRGFECGNWPPPIYEDPQRNPDGGGM